MTHSEPDEELSSSSRIWLGFHDQLGPLVFDPDAQSHLEPGLVRLWMLNTREFKTFQTKLTKPHTTPLSGVLQRYGLSVLLTDHDIVGSVARRYLADRPRPTVHALPTFHDEDDEDFADEDDFDRETIVDPEAWARSEEAGWFYDE